MNARFAEILDGYLRALEVGEAPDREALLARHPDIREELKAALLSLDLVRGAAPSLTGEEAEIGRSFGDYRLLREVGRGGMAVVYEAEQVSLGRRVALKVLPFAAVLDPKQLQRFKNEALAAAHLRHPNIVPVYGVGCERGIHYYAMQYVEGQSLAAAIRGMKEGGAGEGPRTPISSHGSHRELAYIRMAASLGAQAAEALDHAHELGIVHRDVKPGNLLVDLSGTLWVTDFGLARSSSDVGLTMTGELLGTIRYMSPEQAMAKRVPVDHRTDIYSLGATLYELLTLEPAFPGDDAHRLMQDIASKEPAPPRRLNPSLPRDLETVLLKAMAKDPAGRYATAQEVAADLERCLEDKPVLARRPSLAARAGRWSRRHRSLVAASVVVLLLATAATAIDAYRVGRALGRAESNLALARSAVDRYLVEAGIAELEEKPLPPPARRALLEDALKFYEEDLGAQADPGAFNKRVSILHGLHRYDDALVMFDQVLVRHPRDAWALVWRAHMLWHLERFQDALAALDQAIAIDRRRADAHYFRGLVLLSLGRPADALAAHDRAIEAEPSMAKAHYGRGNALCALSRFADALEAYERAIEVGPNPGFAYGAIGNALHALGRFEEAVAAQDRAIDIDPHDASAHVNRGLSLQSLGRLDEAEAAYRRAIRIEPDHAAAHDGLGLVLVATCDVEEGIREHREAVRLRPGDARMRFNLGCALSQSGYFKEAILECRESIRIEPRAEAYCTLGMALGSSGDLAGAIIAYRSAIAANPELAAAHMGLGKAYMDTGNLDAALKEVGEAIRLVPDDAAAHSGQGWLLAAKGRHDEAIAAFLEAKRIRPDAETSYMLGQAYAAKGDLKRAVEALREAARLRPDHAEAHSELGMALERDGDLGGAMKAYRAAIGIKADLPEAHLNLGNALLTAGHPPDEAIQEFRDVIRLLSDAVREATPEGFARVTTFPAPRDPGSATPTSLTGHYARILALAHNSLGTALARKGERDEAIRAFREGIVIDRNLAPLHMGLGNSLAAQGNATEADQEYREAIRIEPGYAEAHCALGRLLTRQGRFREALPSLRVGHELGSKRPGWAYPSGQWVETAERKAKVEERLDRVLAGETSPRDTAERIEFAKILGAQARHAEAARMWIDAFADDAALADNLHEHHRYNAACCAALAAARGQADAAEWRGRALEWLRADLAGREKAPTGLAATLEHWKADPDLASVRDRIDALPEPERDAWRSFWAAVDEALAAAPQAAR